MKKKTILMTILAVLALGLLLSCGELLEDFEEYSDPGINVENLLYVQTNNGLYVSRDNGVSFTQLTSLIYSFAADPLGNILLVNPGLAIYMRDNLGDFINIGTYAGASIPVAKGDGTFYMGGSGMFRWRYKNDVISNADMIDQMTPPANVISYMFMLTYGDEKYLLYQDSAPYNYVSYDIGNIYENVGTGYIYDAVNLDDDTILITRGTGNYIHRSDDGGRTFTDCTVSNLGGYPANNIAVSEAGKVYVSSNSIGSVFYSDGQDLNTWTTSSYAFPFALYYLEAGTDGRLFVGATGYYDLYYTDDDGDSFNIIYTFPGTITGMQVVKGLYPE